MTYHENKRNKLALLYSKQGLWQSSSKEEGDGGVRIFTKDMMEGQEIQCK